MQIAFPDVPAKPGTMKVVRESGVTKVLADLNPAVRPPSRL
jgi:hypothetical protein